ncbi:MFS transporter [Streptacidiphilus sp. EB129]|uniref:MFS transporter n=1 Tax=Streptacidiphilus sp. EB129 TaxID=3156262 RepID=UPI0035146900
MTAGRPVSAQRPVTAGRGVLAATALACGVGVAGIYYAQPLLPALAAAFGVGQAGAAAVVTSGQIGYAAGLLLVVPLGDRHDHRVLARTLLLLAAGAAVPAAAAPSLPVLAAAAVALGVTGSAAQVLVALTAARAPAARRGRAVGTVMAGLTVGILLARVLAGSLATVSSWRAVYAAAAVLFAIAALLVHTVLPAAGAPRGADPGRPGYLRLLAGTVRLAARDPVVRGRCAHGFASFAAFSAFWTPCAYLLAAPPYRFGEAAVGLFGLAGVAGALFAQPAGRLCDGGHARAAGAWFTVLMAVSFVLLAAGRGSLVALATGAVLLDLGLRGAQTANQHRIYQLPAALHSRLTTAYMTCYFLGGAVGSALSAAVYSRAGWTGVCLLGTALAAAPLLPLTVSLLPRAARPRATRRRAVPDGPTRSPAPTATRPAEESR